MINQDTHILISQHKEFYIFNKIEHIDTTPTVMQLALFT